MKFVSVAKDRIVNLAAIADAVYEDSGGSGVRLKLTYISGAIVKPLTGDEARKLWKTLQDLAK